MPTIFTSRVSAYGRIFRRSMSGDDWEDALGGKPNKGEGDIGHRITKEPQVLTK